MLLPKTKKTSSFLLNLADRSAPVFRGARDLPATSGLRIYEHDLRDWTHRHFVGILLANDAGPVGAVPMGVEVHRALDRQRDGRVAEMPNMPGWVSPNNSWTASRAAFSSGDS